jgi:signal transduction histidine kinase
MTPLFRKDRNARLRAIRAYLLIVLFCTLLLFASSVVTLHEQRTLPFETLGLNPAHADFEIWFTAISAILFLSVLAIGLFLLIRVTWDIRWLELRSNFITGVSHEFKTPLSLIRLYSETLADEEANFSPEDRKKYTGIILRESERLSRLINNVLEFTKMEQSSKPGVLPEGDLTPTIAQAIDDYSEYLKWKGFHLSTFIQPDLPPVRFNSEQVSQMILNLLDNARKYSGASREIMLKVRTWEDDVYIEVQDYGIGIPVEEKEKIFQPFYRISEAVEQGGCGLGLYLVARMMKQHGGRVEVESEINRGSLLRLVFPAAGRRSEAQTSTLKQISGRTSSTKQVQANP